MSYCDIGIGRNIEMPASYATRVQRQGGGARGSKVLVIPKAEQLPAGKAKEPHCLDSLGNGTVKQELHFEAECSERCHPFRLGPYSVRFSGHVGDVVEKHGRLDGHQKAVPIIRCRCRVAAQGSRPGLTLSTTEAICFNFRDS